MALQYVGLSEINGPLVVLDHVKDASYDEMVELMRGLLGQVLKTNDFLQFAVLTGCLRR